MTALLRIASWLSVPPSVPPGDPLGTVVQDPDAVRTAACKLVAPDSSCVTVTTKPSTGGSGGSNIADGAISWLSLLLWILLVAALVAVVVLIVLAIARRMPSAAGKQSAGRADDDAVEELDDIGTVAVDRSREPGHWRTEAAAHRQAGRYRDALRCEYRALVGDLARSGLIDEIPGRTTGEERAQLRRVLPDAHRPFTAAADLFDGAWYGHRAVDAAADEEFRALEQQVLAASGGGRR